jgi:hypothetical protein
MNSDVFIETGYDHAICQDYAMSNDRARDGSLIGPPFVIVCDGCSSAKDSDFGSRLLARAARKYIWSDLKFDGWLAAVLATADGYRTALGLPAECLRSTLLVAELIDNEFRVRATGDGVIAALHDDGTLEWSTIKYKSKGAYYLQYEGDPAAKKKYLEDFGTAVELRDYVLRPGEALETSTQQDEFEPGDAFSEAHYSTDEFRAIALMTDGVDDFTKRVETSTSVVYEPVPMEAIVPGLLAFKGYQGKFVQRRCKRALEDFAKQGRNNRDDVSVGVVCK